MLSVCGDASGMRMLLRCKGCEQHAGLHTGYYGEAANGCEAKTRFKPGRTRDAVEDEVVRQLAGVEPYRAGQVWRRTPLLDLSDGELCGLCEQ